MYAKSFVSHYPRPSAGVANGVLVMCQGVRSEANSGLHEVNAHFSGVSTHSGCYLNITLLRALKSLNIPR